MFEVKTQNGVPIFEQLKQQILEYITAGILHDDEQLPSVRMLATSLGINPNTVAKAYQKLEDKKIIYTIPGKGCYITTKYVDELIREEKITRFEASVLDLKGCHVQSRELIGRIERIYGEEDLHA